MYLKGVLILVFLLIFNAVGAFADVITIDSEPPELIKLRKTYEAAKQQAVSPAKINEFKSKLAADRQDALRSIPYVQKRRALEAARDQEIVKIKATYQAKLASLEKASLSSIKKKQQLELAAFKNKTLNQTQTNYISQLEKLEKQLISKSDLAGALVVQIEKKKAMGISPKAPVASKPSKPAAKPKTEKQPTPSKPPVAAKPAVVTMSQANPLSQVSTQNGVAGSSGNMKNNVYPFRMDQVGKNSKLIFHAYGKKNNDTYGEVYLIMPSGKRKEVVEWSPKNLKSTSFYVPKSAKDIKPIVHDISRYVKTPGLYKVEFKYKDGDEALQIYRVEIQTW